jgi:hypothetical protein
MTPITIAGVRLKGIASAVPEHVRTVEEDAKVFPDSDVLKISESTGVKKSMWSRETCAPQTSVLQRQSGFLPNPE